MKVSRLLLSDVVWGTLLAAAWGLGFWTGWRRGRRELRRERWWGDVPTP